MSKSASIEVVVSWAGNPLDTTEWTEANELRIGPSGESWFSFPKGVLAADHALLTPADDGYRLVSPPGASILVNNAAGETVAAPVEGIVLDDGMTAEISLGEFELFVRAGDKVEDTTPRVVGGYRWTRWVAVAGFLHALVLGMFAVIPPGASALNSTNIHDATRYVNVSIAAMAQPEPESIPMSTGENGGAPGLPAGQEGGNEAQTMSEAGSPAPRRDHARNTPPTERPTADTVSEFGILPAFTQAVASFGDDTSPFTAGNATAGPGGLATAELLAMPGGPSWGGLRGDLRGVGTCNPRVEDCGAGIIHARLRTEGPGVGPGPGFGDRGTVRIPPPPPGTSTTLGGLSREQVRLTIRRHVNEVRHCYEQGLQRQPSLEGRVAVQFIIAPSGAVQSSSVSNSTVRDNQVASCVSQAVNRWTFPATASPTGVTYPFLMQTN